MTELEEIANMFLYEFSKYSVDSCEINLGYDIEQYLIKIKHRYKDKLTIDVLLDIMKDYFEPTKKISNSQYYRLTGNGISFTNNIKKKMGY